MSTHFTVTQSSDPHRKNRLRYLRERPEVRELFGYDRRTAVLGGLGAVVLQRFAVHHGRLASAALLVGVAYTLGAVLNHFSGVVIHEAAHNLCAKTTTANRWVAMLANVPVIVPSAMSFRRHHWDHHRYLGIVGLDNDLPTRFEVEWLGRSRLGKTLWLLTYPFFGTMARGYLRPPQRWELIGLGVQLLANIAIVALFGWVALAYLLVSTYFAYGPHPIAAHFVHEHYLWSSSQETYSYYGPFNRVALNMGFHNEHHDFPSVPGARLPELHRLLGGHYGALQSDPSWSKVLLRFLFDTRIGHHSRFERTLAVFTQANGGAA
jgi:sphingolipid 4-desaturase/C4-monooxygenase